MSEAHPVATPNAVPNTVSYASPIVTAINQTAHLLQAQSLENTPFFGLIIVEQPQLLTEIQAAYKTPTLNLSQSQFHIILLSDFLAQDFSQYYELAVLILGNNDKPSISPQRTQTITTTIQRCRDLFARHSVIFAPQSADFLAFGFSKISQQPLPLGELPYLAWQFNLYDYKQLPDWFNSRFWANPENWNKFRW